MTTNAPETITLACAAVFDGENFNERWEVTISNGRIAALAPIRDADRAVLPGTLMPGFVDLQVNGGGGVMFNDDPSCATLATIAAAHARLGATSILPTLITDRPEASAAAIEAVAEANSEGVAGLIGLHMEGPHLARAGAHDLAFLRPMSDADLTLYCDAANRLPVLMLTVAPEVVSAQQITALAEAGAVVSLGHTNANYDTCRSAIAAGARVFTHLFNAMSPMASREPGAVGAALACGDVSAGLIADGIHVHPATIGTALRAKQGPGQLFLVSDAMATAGSDTRLFLLNGRTIRRQDDRLTLADGTLAGAHLALADAIAMVQRGGAAPAAALAMATSIPARVAGLTDGRGMLRPGAPADMVLLGEGGQVSRIWQEGREIAPYADTGSRD